MEALKFRKAILLVSLCLWTLTVFPQVKEDTIFQSDYLLILNTYTSDAPWSNAIISPVLQWLNMERKTEVYVENMNMLMIDDSLKLADLKTNIFAKYGKKKPKAVLRCVKHGEMFPSFCAGKRATWVPMTATSKNIR